MRSLALPKYEEVEKFIFNCGIVGLGRHELDLWETGLTRKAST